MDLALFNFIHGFADNSFLLDWLTIFFAQYFQYFLVVLLLSFWIYGKNEPRLKNRIAVIAGFASAILSRIVFVGLFRIFYFRPRPFFTLDFQPLFNHANESSFPSGHAATFFALAAGVYFYDKKLGALFFAGAVLISGARILGGVHWPSDILAGAILGIFSAYLIKRFAGSAIRRLVSKGN
ncbi:hypothetical protein A2W39_03010 [Candidatus Azambacteria bacterium RIFCSPHIGHO2_01_46_10]|uniref:Phosphatidic acid phosphatase type 2/haloperoxidase domain-containing protein n=1 Tax=Candidatus Azambacteria bacterium RIFCSPHIGHO2_01_46_10 TaxID=1797293 RepID=A0A1F5BZJ5_9BACT|nr:MAG: hypothetical protein A2W39_03010 [Candidatus Azambacteria bacterium RIFCSPHIGHO2_01_46_10]